MAKKKTKKIVKYRRPLNINVGMIIFMLIFIYMVFSVYTYIRRDKVQFYEVQEGSIVNDKNYTGIILRDETTKYTDRAGYISYYIREGKRASVGTRVYSIDETGSMSDFLQENSDTDMPLSSESISDLKKQLTSFSLAYRDNNFSSVYDMKYSIEAAVLEYANLGNQENLDNLMSQAGINFQQVRADQAGVVSYAIDSYEDLDAASISEQVFDRTSYSKSIVKSGLVEKDVPVYKIITSDQWSLVFPLSEDDITRFTGITSLQVSFKGKDLTTDAAFSIITGVDGKQFGKLDFKKYMIQFEADRYLEFEILSEKADGLKIPVSAVTSKSFYTVPLDYLTQGGDSTETGFNKEVYSDAGTSVIFVPTTIYYSAEDSYYIDMSDKNELKAGDYIVKPNSTERYQIGTNASLQGVYNINKGYAVFKQIEILATNNEYYSIKKNMDYGLSVYDHIVLDATTVGEGELIYQ